jgi:hypothetical protein
MNEKVPWYAAIILVLLKLVGTRYPQVASVTQDLVSYLTILWFGHVASTMEALKQNGNGNSGR